MKRQLKILLLGLGVITATNAVALLGVAYNRSAEPEAVLELTERELTLPYRYISKDENSGLMLHLIWRVLYQDEYRGGQAAEWLTQEKLQTLGLDLPDDIADETAARPYYKLRPHEVFVVLEYDGERYQQALAMQDKALAEAQALLMNNPDKDEFKQRVEQELNQLELERDASSRLFVIDAGLDAAQLRQRYADPSRYLILKGLVNAAINREADGRYVTKGIITQLLVDDINVPLSYRSRFDSLDDYSRGDSRHIKTPRYAIKLAVGKRFEPWIIDVRALK